MAEHVHHHNVSIIRGSSEIHGRIVTPESNSKKGIVVLIPGYGSNQDNFSNRFLSVELASRDIASLAVTLTGHGNLKRITTSLPEMEADIYESLKHAFQLGYEKVGLYVVSMSSIPAMHAAARIMNSGMNIYAVGCKSPVLNLEEAITRALGSGSIKEWEKKGTLAFPREDGSSFNVPFSVFQQSANYRVNGTRLKTKALISFGSKDPLVTRQEIEQFGKMFEDFEVREYDAGHSIGIQGDYITALKPYVGWFHDTKKR